MVTIKDLAAAILVMAKKEKELTQDMLEGLLALELEVPLDLKDASIEVKAFRVPNGVVILEEARNGQSSRQS